MGCYNCVEPVLTPSLTPAIMVCLMERTSCSVAFHNLLRPLSNAYPCDVIDPKQPGDDIVICGPGKQLHCHGTKLLHACFRPVLQTRLRQGEKEGISREFGVQIRSVHFVLLSKFGLDLNLSHPDYIVSKHE